ncbi:MAG: molecular chaperone SurA, partial [Pseudomonas sp.]|nr:molecular chaperone SurA [Pseudomonas sp.]
MKTKLSDRLRPLLLGAALLAATAQAQVRPLDRVVAIVDNDVVMQSQLDARLREVQQTIDKRGGSLPPGNVLSQQVLERLIIENIQLQIGDRSGIRITDEELSQAMGTIAQRNGMSLEQFREALARDGLSYADARDQVRREMIISRVRQRRVAERIQVTDQEVQNFLASDLGKMQLSEEFRLANILIPVSEGASSNEIQAAERQAQEVYQQLQQGADFAQLAIARSASETALEGGEMGWRKAGQLPPPFDSMISQLNPGEVTEPVRTPGGFIILKLIEKRGGDTQVRDEVHVRHILIKPSEIRSEEETRRLVERLYQRIVDGEDFAELAKSFSEDPGSALNGGDLNWIDPNALVPEFREVMNNTASGELSKPFKSPYGWHVLQVMGRRATDSSAQFREQQAANLLRNRKYDEELQA